jgi:hypothetical protein
MVAMLIFAVLAVVSLAFVLASLSATALARTDTVAKNLNQELLENMRNLPFFVHANVSTVPDLLDTYYTSTLTPAAGIDDSGFVADGAPRDPAKGDPATGPFFRRVLPAPDGYPDYTRRVTAQFLGNGSAVLAAPVFVSTSTGSEGLPPSTTIAVRVSTLWTSDARPRVLSVESQITDGAVKSPLVTLQARLSVLRFAGILPDARETVAEAGLLSMDGSLSSTTVASAVAQGARAVVSGGDIAPKEGARGKLAAPPTSTLTVEPLGPLTLTHGETVAGFSGTSVDGLTVRTDGGQPGVGTASAPVRAVLNGAGTGSSYFAASNLPTAGGRLGLVDYPVVRGAASSCGGDCEAVAATGSLVSAGGSAHSATAALRGAVTGTVALLPTTAAPEGIIQVELDSLAVTCQSKADQSPPGSVAVAYSGRVKHRTYDPITGATGYATVLIDAEADTDPLAAVDLQTPVGVDGDGALLRLADYVQSWSSLTETAVASATVVATDGTAASIDVPGVFTFTSQPLRPDPVSTVGVQVGVFSCTAADVR